jgi:hypothetical protein
MITQTRKRPLSADDKTTHQDNAVLDEKAFEDRFGPNGTIRRFPPKFNASKEGVEGDPTSHDHVMVNSPGGGEPAEYKRREVPYYTIYGISSKPVDDDTYTTWKYRSYPLGTYVAQTCFTLNVADIERYFENKWEHMPMYLEIAWKTDPDDPSEYDVQKYAQESRVLKMVSIHVALPTQFGGCEEIWLKNRENVKGGRDADGNKCLNYIFDIRKFPCIFASLSDPKWTTDPRLIAHVIKGEISKGILKSNHFLLSECFGNRRQITQEAYHLLEREGIAEFVHGVALRRFDSGSLEKDGYESSLPENAGLKGTFKISHNVDSVEMLAKLLSICPSSIDQYAPRFDKLPA